MMFSKRNLLVAGASLLALTGFGALFTLIVGSGLSRAEKLGVAMTLLDEGRWDLAGRIARDLQTQSIDEENDSAWHFVQGVSKLKSVEANLDSPKNRRVLLDATDHLEKAEKLGFPLGYLGKGKHYLGWCYFNTYQWEKASKQLADADRLWPEKRSDALRMQVESQLRKTPADVPAAEAALAAWETIPGMSRSELDRIKLAKANLAFVKHRLEQCEKLLADVGGESLEGYQAMLWRTRWRLARAVELSDLASTERKKLLEEATNISKILKVSATTPVDLRRQATYLSGRILREQGAFNEALSTFSGARQSSPQSAEAIASGMEESEILIETNVLDGALATLQYLLRNIEDLSLYNEMWIPVPEFRARLLEIGRKLRNRGEFQRALDLAELIALAFPRSDSVRLQAEALEQWADALASGSPGNNAQSQQAFRERVREKQQAAGERYETLARLELRSTEYPDILWSSISNFHNAGDLSKANELLTDYLRYEDRTKRPRGFLALGRNYVNAAQWQKAIEPLERCRIEHPTHPISFEARLLEAKALFELDRLDEATELLNENLSGSITALRPTSDIWRDSLYQLAQTVFRQGDELLLDLRLNPASSLVDKQSKLEESQAKFRDVVDQLGGFVTRYPNDPRHFDAMYLVAKSHRLAAETPQQIATANSNMVETARRKLMQERRLLLEQALDEFRQLHHMITQQQDSLTFSDSANALIRNCFFGEADTLYELGRWDEAIEAYQNVASRFLNKPESLEALLQMAECYRKLGQNATAKRVLAQAEQVLTRIPNDLDTQFISLTRTNREGWSDLLGSLKRWD